MNAVVEFAHGLVLLFGIGTGALPSWDTKKRRNNLLGGLAVSAMAGPSGHTNSPHPSSREGHHSTRWSSSFLLSGDPEWFSCCCRGLLLEFAGRGEALPVYSTFRPLSSAAQVL